MSFLLRNHLDWQNLLTISYTTFSNFAYNDKIFVDKYLPLLLHKYFQRIIWLLEKNCLFHFYMKI